MKVIPQAIIVNDQYSVYRQNRSDCYSIFNVFLENFQNIKICMCLQIYEMYRADWVQVSGQYVFLKYFLITVQVTVIGKLEFFLQLSEIMSTMSYQSQ